MSLAFTLLAVGSAGAILSAATACGGGEQDRPAELAVGDPAPGFSLPGSDGSIVSLSGYLGNSDVLLYFHMGYG